MRVCLAGNINVAQNRTSCKSGSMLSWQYQSIKLDQQRSFPCTCGLNGMKSESRLSWQYQCVNPVQERTSWQYQSIKAVQEHSTQLSTLSFPSRRLALKVFLSESFIGCKFKTLVVLSFTFTHFSCKFTMFSTNELLLKN